MTASRDAPQSAVPMGAEVANERAQRTGDQMRRTELQLRDRHAHAHFLREIEEEREHLRRFIYSHRSHHELPPKVREALRAYDALETARKALSFLIAPTCHRCRSPNLMRGRKLASWSRVWRCGSCGALTEVTHSLIGDGRSYTDEYSGWGGTR